VRVTDGGKGTLVGNKVVSNALAGLKVDGAGSSPDVTKGSVSENEEEGILVVDSGGGCFCGIDVAGNRGHGAAVSSANEDTMFRANTFRDGRLSGMHFLSGGTGIAESNDVCDNAEVRTAPALTYSSAGSASAGQASTSSETVTFSSSPPSPH
jgi:hypothetical protein